MAKMELRLTLGSGSFPVTIHIDEIYKGNPTDYRQEGVLLANALYEALPSGTYNAMKIVMEKLEEEW